MTECTNFIYIWVLKAPTVKGQGLKFKSSHLQDPQLSVKRGHIQWITSFQQTYVHRSTINITYTTYECDCQPILIKEKQKIHLLVSDAFTINEIAHPVTKFYKKLVFLIVYKYLVSCSFLKISIQKRKFFFKVAFKWRRRTAQEK